MSLEDYLLSQLKDGANLGKVYDSVLNKVKKERPDLVDKLTRNFGFGMGIEFRDAAVSIAANSTVTVRSNMVFNVNLGINGLTNKDASDAKGRDIALFVGDTALVGQDGATLLTASKKKIKNIAIFLKDADSSEEEKENKASVLPDPENFGRGKRTAVLEQKLRCGLATLFFRVGVTGSCNVTLSGKTPRPKRGGSSTRRS